MSSRYLTREQRLKNKLKEELSQKQPNINTMMVAINEFEQSNLDTIAKLNRDKKVDDKKIQGALKQTINAHGPITMDFIGSATKRINGALLTNETTKCPEPETPKIPIRVLALGIGIGMFILSLINYFIK